MLLCTLQTGIHSKSSSALLATDLIKKEICKIFARTWCLQEQMRYQASRRKLFCMEILQLNRGAFTWQVVAVSQIHDRGDFSHRLFD